MGDQWNTRLTLIQRAQDPDDHSAWDDFVNFYKCFIEMILNKSRVSLNDADDLVQEILLKVWKGLPNYEYRKNKTKFRGWLSILIRNTIINHSEKRKRKDSGKVEIEAAETSVLSQSDIESVIAEEWVVHLTSLALNNLKKSFSTKAITTFELSLKGKTAKEISKAINVTEDSVLVLRSRVKTALRREIDFLKRELEFDE